MNKNEKAKRNKLIADFIRKTYPDGRTYNNFTSGSFYNIHYANYYSNSYKTCNTLKFPIYKNPKELDLNLLENFLKDNNISFINIKSNESVTYFPYRHIVYSIIIRFDKNN